jgi:Protein of unknown function (DUF1176)
MPVRVGSIAVLAVAAVAVSSSAFAGSPLPGTRTANDRAAWRAIVRWPAACERTWQKDLGAGITVWRANSEVRLVEVSCLLGAYQGTGMLYFVRTDRRVDGPLPLLIYEDPGTGVPTARRRTVILGTIDFDARTERLTVLDKARGIGDCGIFSTFGLSDDRFVLLETRAKLACNGKPPFDPARWTKLPLPRG